MCQMFWDQVFRPKAMFLEWIISLHEVLFKLEYINILAIITLTEISYDIGACDLCYNNASVALVYYGIFFAKFSLWFLKLVVLSNSKIMKLSRTSFLLHNRLTILRRTEE